MALSQEKIGGRCLSVPVFVDSVKTAEGFQMTRCGYFSVTCEEPQFGWALTLEEHRLDLLLLGLSGIVTSPIGGGLFNSPDEIDHLYEVIEDAGLSLETGSVFVPNSAYTYEDGAPPGTVLRVSRAFFKSAYRHSLGGIPTRVFEDESPKEPASVVVSRSETAVFRKWHDREIETLKEQFPKQEALMLRWKDTEGEEA